MGKLIISIFVLILLIGCQQTTRLPESEGQKTLIQCSNGQVVSDVSQCPRQATTSAPVVSEPQEAPLESKSDSVVQKITDTTVIPAPKKTQLQELLEKAPTAYIFDSKESSFVVLGNKRRMLYTATIERSDLKKMPVYDDSEKMLYVYYGEILAKWWADHKHLPALTGMDASTKKYPAYLQIQITGNKETDEANLPKDDYNRPLVRKEVLNTAYEKSPIDFLKIYQSEPVLKTDTVPKQITTMNGQSNIAFHFNSKESPGKVIILRIHEGTQLPLLIEEINQQGIVTRFYEYDFDTSWVDKPIITEDDLALAKEAIIVTPYDDIRAYKKYLDEKDKSSGGDTYNVDIYVI